MGHTRRHGLLQSMLASAAVVASFSHQLILCHGYTVVNTSLQRKSITRMHHPSHWAFTTRRQYIPSASTLCASVDDNTESSSSNSDNEVEANDTTEANFYNDFDDFFPSSKQQESPISQATDEQIISQLQKRQE
eukprot:scaffold39919_cov161-Skeletonema_marinoi.AAC.2